MLVVRATENVLAGRYLTTPAIDYACKAH